MKLVHKGFLTIMTLLILSSCGPTDRKKKVLQSEDMIIRISKIEIDPDHLQQYISILKEEAEASVRLEQGVISIYPMYRKDQPSSIRILEIYENQEAYQSHLETPHFQHYKTNTLEMVKSLELVDMYAIDGETMPKIFSKLEDTQVESGN